MKDRIQINEKTEKKIERNDEKGNRKSNEKRYQDIRIYENIKIKKVQEYIYEVEKQGKMNVPVRIFASEKLMELIKKDQSLQQGMNVACLPNIQKYSYMMPDAHQGYGMSVGGVAAFPVEDGIISPGCIGFDINCGVRLLATTLQKKDVEPKIKQLLDELFKNVPSGVGRDSQIKLSIDELDRVLKTGAQWAVENSYAFPEDLEVTESNGCLEKATPNAVSANAMQLSQELSFV